MVRAVAFDFGGVLELTPPTGWQPRWGSQLGLSEEQFRTLLADAVHAGSLGHIDLEQCTATAQGLLGDDEQTVAFIDDIWHEYLGSPNTELFSYFTGSGSGCAPGSSRTASSVPENASRIATGSRTAAT
jgi:hypothetical protein